jgi:hypothetical protein
MPTVSYSFKGDEDRKEEELVRLNLQMTCDGFDHLHSYLINPPLVRTKRTTPYIC